MRLSCDPILFFREIAVDRTMSLQDWFRMAADLGLTGTEIQHNCLRSYEPDYLEKIADAVKKAGLELSQLISAPDFANPDPEYRAGEVQKLKRHVDIAAFFGAHCVRITAGQEYPDVPLEQGVAWAVECFRECLEYADQKAVWLAYENHYKDYFWERPDFSMRQAIYLKILNQLRNTSLKVNFDCANPIMIGENPLALLRKVVDRVVHVHCTDRAARLQYAHAVAGEGLVDYPAVFEILKRAGYDGWLSIEYNGPEGLEGLKRAIAYIRKTWEEVQPPDPTVQVSLDVTSIKEALEMAEIAVRAGVDWLEAGTPLILAEGLHAIRALKERFPDKPVVADLKTMDGGYLEAEMMAQAGADIVVVMGVAHPATIKAVVRAAKDYNIKVMGDILGAPDKVGCARMMEEIGVDYIIAHTGYDERREVIGASPLDDLEAIVDAVRVPVQAVGGLSIEQAMDTLRLGADIVVIGAPLAIDADRFAAASTDLEAVLRTVVKQVKQRHTKEE